MAVRHEPRRPAERRSAPGRRTKRQPQPQERALEQAGLPVTEELQQREAGVIIGQREGRAEVVQQAILDRLSLSGRQQLTHRSPRFAYSTGKPSCLNSAARTAFP